jgi:hypothetical protein
VQRPGAHKFDSFVRVKASAAGIVIAMSVCWRNTV